MHELKWGGIVVLASFVWVCLEYVFGLHDQHIALQPLFTTLWIPFAGLLVFVALREKRRACGGRLGYWQGVRSAALMGIVVGLLTPPSIWVFFHFVNPGFFDDMIAQSVATGVPRGEAEAYFNQSRYLLMEGVGGFLGTLLAGLLVMFFLRTPAARGHAATGKGGGKP
jgi:hypothetical protein